MKKKALVIGVGEKVASIAKFLVNEGYRVAVICHTRKDADWMAQMTGLPVVFGDATIPDILVETGMKNADIALSMLSSDQDNFVASLLCKRVLNVIKVITVAQDEKELGDFYQAGIDSVICEMASITSLLKQQNFLDGVATLVPLSGGQVNVMEVPVCESAPVVGKKLWEIELPNEVIVGCVLRNEHSIVPRGDTRILAGDTLVLIASDKEEVEAVRKLTGSAINTKRS